MLARVILVVTMTLASRAAADPPSAYSCGSGKPVRGQGCKCPADEVSRRDADNTAICVKRPPPPDTATCENISLGVASDRRYLKNADLSRVSSFRGALAAEAAKLCKARAWSREIRRCFETSADAGACTDKLDAGTRAKLEAEAERLRPVAPKPPPPPPAPAVDFEPEAQAGPPSKTLERAIKLYDKKDYFSAGIELQKVLDGETGDDAKNKQRAEFFLAKTQYQMGFYVAALAQFEKILLAGEAHSYYLATYKWLVAVLKVAGMYAASDKLGSKISFDMLEDPLYANVVDELRVVLAKMSSDKQRARTLLGGVAPSSTSWHRSRLELARLEFADGSDLDTAILHALEATADPTIADDAIRDVLNATHAANAHARARSLIAKHVDRPTAAFAMSRFALEDTGGFPGLEAIPHPAFEARVVAAVCTHGPTDDVFSIWDDHSTMLKTLLEIDDNAELFEAVRAKLKGTTQAARFLQLVLDEPYTRERVAFRDEVAKELVAYARTDRAWQTTQVATGILTELTLVQSLADAAVGKVYRQRLDEIRRELAKDFFGNDGERAGAGPAVKAGEGLRVTDCSRFGVTLPTAAPSSSPAVIAPRARGCCATGTPDAAIALALLALFRPRRRGDHAPTDSPCSKRSSSPLRSSARSSS